MGRVAVVSLFWLAACGIGTEGPEGVARDFWDAARSGDRARMEAVSVTGTVRINTDEGLDYEDLTLDDPLVAGDSARVPTTMTLRGDTGARMPIRFDTRLVRRDGDWKVDVNATAGAMVGAALGTSVRGLAEDMGRALGGAMRGFLEGFREAAAPASDSLVARDTAR